MSTKKEREKLRETIKADQLKRTPDLSLADGDLKNISDAMEAHEREEQNIGGRLNALKHGGYSESLFLPFEEDEEFELLHQSLILEWKPNGASEEDAVLTLAICYWQKRRVNRWYDVESEFLSEYEGEYSREELALILLLIKNCKHLTAARALLSTLPAPYSNHMLPHLNNSQFTDEKQEIERLLELLENCISIEELKSEMMQKTPRFRYAARRQQTN